MGTFRYKGIDAIRSSTPGVLVDVYGKTDGATGQQLLATIRESGYVSIETLLYEEEFFTIAGVLNEVFTMLKAKDEYERKEKAKSVDLQSVEGSDMQASVQGDLPNEEHPVQGDGGDVEGEVLRDDVPGFDS